MTHRPPSSYGDLATGLVEPAPERPSVAAFSDDRGLDSLSAGEGLHGHFDAVVMLTWSNWKTEPRSNRYHYATRFARHLPVIFVQPDIAGDLTYSFEPTETPNVTILHVYAGYGPQQSDLIAAALRERRIVRPLQWIYNYSLHDYVVRAFAPLKVYHATEDYFSGDFRSGPPLDALRRVLNNIDLLVAVSEPVLEDYQRKGGYGGPSLVATNGCDYKFWVRDAEPLTPDERPVAIFQGGINYRLDFAMLDELTARMPDWEFRFCGRDSLPTNGHEPVVHAWRRTLHRRNVRFLGQLDSEQIRRELNAATVGLIPFVQNDMIDRSFPLKAFEYAACGLPVVTVPIRSLRLFGNLFHEARDADEFERGLRELAVTRHDVCRIAARRAAASQQDYDDKFSLVASEIIRGVCQRPRPSHRYNVLMLFDPGSLHVMTICEHLEAFSRHSRHRFWFVPATRGAECNVDLRTFDAVVLHYSVRLSLLEHIAPSYAKALSEYSGLKIAFLQDEYETTNVACDWIERLGFQVVYTCVPTEEAAKVYSPARFPHVRLIENLTGYVPERFRTLPGGKPLSQRAIMIGYRGRPLPYWYGQLGQEKIEIGRRMRDICTCRGIPCNIEWAEEKRIYGSAWYEFLGSCRATLASESGSNLFDWNGSIRSFIEQGLQQTPDMSFAEAQERFFPGCDGEIRMNQISPKVFEAAALRTALILYEGKYSGVVQPDVHYIPLKKDFSNIEDVLEKLHDDAYIERITDRAFQDIVASGHFGYGQFIQGVDEVLEQERGQGHGFQPITLLAGHENSGAMVALIGETLASLAAAPDFSLNRDRCRGTTLSIDDILDTTATSQMVRMIGRRHLPISLKRILKPPLRVAWRLYKRVRWGQRAV